MKKEMLALFALLSFFCTLVFAKDKPIYYGDNLCQFSEFKCIKVKRGDSWERLFEDEDERDIVQRINRSYNRLSPGKILVVPKRLNLAQANDFSPFPHRINNEAKEKQIIVDQQKLAWAAYDPSGNLLKWGPIASGSDICSDRSSSNCRTMTGIFRIFSKEGQDCKSGRFPLGRGGAKMPYCMFFHKGFALHGSADLPGYRASHGCVRMFTRDAKWLNHEFVEVSGSRNNYKGTMVVIRALPPLEKKHVPID